MLAKVEDFMRVIRPTNQQPFPYGFVDSKCLDTVTNNFHLPWVVEAASAPSVSLFGLSNVATQLPQTIRRALHLRGSYLPTLHIIEQSATHPLK